MKTAALLKLNSPRKEVDGVLIVHHHIGPCFDRYVSSAKQGRYHVVFLTKNTSGNGRSTSYYNATFEYCTGKPAIMLEKRWFVVRTWPKVAL